MNLLKIVFEWVNNPGQTVRQGDTNRLRVYRDLGNNRIQKVDEITSTDQDILKQEAEILGHEIKEKSWLRGKKILK